MTVLLRRGDPGYEEARAGRIFNARRPERYPAAILLASDAEDVATGVKWARSRQKAVSIRSGGHSWAAWSLRDDALLIDLGNLNGLDYDEAAGVLTAGPAARGGLDVAPFLAERGRAFPGGHCPTVGLGGYLLQGGQGWNSRRMGWACENVVAVDVVTADGELVRADATRNSDLLWAARGAGPGFPGIVTAFHLQTYEAPAVMWHDTRSFRPEDGAVLLAWLHYILPALDRRIEPVLAATRLPEEPQAEGLLPIGKQSKGTTGKQSKGAAGEPPLPMGKQSKGTTGKQSKELVLHRYAVDCTWTDAPADVLAPLLDDAADDEKYRSWVHERTADIARGIRGGLFASYLTADREGLNVHG